MGDSFPMPAESPFAPTALPSAFPFPTVDLGTVIPTDEIPPEAQPSVTATDSLTAEAVPSVAATDLSGVTITPTAEPDVGEPIDVTDATFPVPSPDSTETESVEVTATVEAPEEAAACAFDVDADGEITEGDLQELAQTVLNTGTNETTVVYDLNANDQIDIGDLQMMTSYLDETCHD
jgi:hypothetical protein